MVGGAETLLLLILAFIFPPAAVTFVAGCGPDLCLNILLTLLGDLPGMIHAFWLIFRRAQANKRYGYKNWVYTGMGEYHRCSSRRRSMSSQAPGPYRVPPPPPGRYPGKETQPVAVPVDRKQAFAPQPPPVSYQAMPSQGPGYSQPEPQAHVTDQKVSAEQKRVETPVQGAAPASGT